MARASTPPEESEAGPSTANTQANGKMTQREVYIYKVFERFDVGSFDWAAYEGTYKGRALITRLMHICTLIRLPAPLKSPDPPAPLLEIMRKALNRVIALIKDFTWDVQTYSRAITILEALDHIERKGDMEIDGKPALESGRVDLDWVEAAKDNEKKESAKLDVELRGYMSNLIKESIRLTHLAMAELGLKSGSPQAAFRNYSAAREYSTSPQHHLDLQTATVDTCLSFNYISTLPGHITKLEAALNRVYPSSTTDKNGGSAKTAQDIASMTASDVRDSREREAKGSAVKQRVATQIRVAKGLLALHDRRFEDAGRQFAEIGEEGGLKGWEGVAISTADVALITALCVLATGDRSRIKRVLLERPNFRTSLDDSQIWILDLVQSFMAADYAKASQILRTAEPNLLLNPFLEPHVSEFRLVLDSKSIIQYVEPFLSVRISTMASSFGVDEYAMLEQLADLIYRKKIKGKIDLIDKVLTLNEVDPRAKLLENALSTGRDIAASSHAALARMKMHEAGISVDPKRKKDEEDEEVFAEDERLAQATQATQAAQAA